MPPNVELRQDDGRMPHPGATLQAGREAKGLSAGEAATSLRLPEKILAHLEAGRFDQLPGDTFARGYVRSYARLLGLDANRLVLEYDRSRGIEVRERQVSGIDKMGRPGRTGSTLLTWTTVVVALAIFASLLLWWYDSQPAPANEDISSIASQVLDEVEVDAMALPEDFAADPELPEETVLALPGLVLPATDAEVAAASAEEQQALLTPGQTELSAEDAGIQPVAPEGETAPSQAATTEAADQSVASVSGLRMQFTGDCWVQVTTPGGETLHSALMQAGQSLAIDHQGPFDVVIGAVEAVSQIAFNGESVNTQGVRDSGVVRLRLG